ncbi:ankyrin repeat domain-containing protein [Faecalimicrobium sp. JNUCC 81]
MDEKELFNLQRYIYKPQKGQSTEDVIKHIKKINDKHNLIAEEWNKLLYPVCACNNIELLEWISNNGADIRQECVKLMKHTINSKEERFEYILKRINTLEFLIKFLNEDYKNAIGNTLINACWYNNLGVVKYLIEKGADLEFKSDNGLTALECAQKYGERFSDYTLYEYLEKYINTDVLENIEKYYQGSNIFYNDIYKPIKKHG